MRIVRNVRRSLRGSCLQRVSLRKDRPLRRKGRRPVYITGRTKTIASCCTPSSRSHTPAWPKPSRRSRKSASSEPPPPKTRGPRSRRVLFLHPGELVPIVVEVHEPRARDFSQQSERVHVGLSFEFDGHDPSRLR